MIFTVKPALTKSQTFGYTLTQVLNGREHVKDTQRTVFTKKKHIFWYIPGIYQVYTQHCAPAERFLASFVSQAREEDNILNRSNHFPALA